MEARAMKRVRRNELKSKNMNQIILMSAWSFTLVISSFLFLYVGRWIDVQFQTEPTFMVGLFVLAITLCIGRMYMDFNKIQEQMGRKVRRHRA